MSSSAERTAADTSIEKSALAVLGNTVATGALGASFWLVAAALFSEEVVAASVAASSVLIAISFVAQLNLNTGLSRFVPGAGARQRWTVVTAYRSALVVAGVAAAGVMLVGIARGGSIITGGDLGLTVVLALSIPVWVVFALQDGALIALRRAHWLAVENGLTTVAKLALLVAFVAVPGRFAILLAWTLPAVPAVYVVNRLMFRRVLDPGQERGASSRSLIRYAISDLPGAAANLLALRLVPVIIVESISGDRSAYLAVPWSILTVAALSLGAISRVVLSEMSRHPDRASDVSRRSTRFVLALFVPGAVVGALLASPVLGLAGSGYASSGGRVLALGLLGLIPAALIECRFAVYRFHGRMMAVTRRQMLRATLLLGATVGLIAVDRASWIGGAFLVVNCLVVFVVRLDGSTGSEAGPSVTGAALRGGHT